ncbi:SGNH/GDSL hydrolase family protein [Halobacillus mangrovi]|uniref:SGNH/GDSL hydrolase family protein n=1 Tax=Halobacillus mangrovi TaxID=402384 RepID=UPI003D97D254
MKYSKILFIGDSITESGRFDDTMGIGNGYVHKVVEKLGLPLDNVLNRGLGGDQIVDLAKRWEQDVLAERPDLLSISIGVNDVWRQLDSPEMNQISHEQFKKTYVELLEKTLGELNPSIVLMEPTIIGEDPESEGNKRLKEYVQAVREAAEQFECSYVPLHGAFIKQLRGKVLTPLTTDGVHMNERGDELMAVEWVKATRHLF